MNSLQETSAGTPVRVTTELWFDRGLWAVGLLAAVVIAISAGIMLWAENELSPAESLVAAHSLMFAHGDGLYYGFNQYPYTVSAYMPVFHVLQAGLIMLGLPAFMAGRLISLSAFLGMLFFVSSTVRVYTGDRRSQMVAAILAGISPLTVYWGVVGHVDMLALCFATGAMYQFSRHYLLGEATLWRAGAFAALALFTKQVMIAAPATICLLLLLRDWKVGVRFALGLAAALGSAIWILNTAMGGSFIQNTLLANINPLSWEKLQAQALYFGGVSGGLLVLALAVVARVRLAVAVYAGAALLVFLGTAPKLGSDTNYQMETTMALVVCSVVGLHRMDFFRLFFEGSKSWVTLLILPLAVHIAVGARVASNIFLIRVANEQAFRSQVAALAPLTPARGGLVICTDYNAMVRLRQRLDVEPLIYGLLVNAGLDDPEPIRRDLSQRAIPTVILHEDVFHPQPLGDSEIASLPAAQLEEIRRHYRMTAHVPGPFLNGVYVYQPAEQEIAAQ